MANNHSRPIGPTLPRWDVAVRPRLTTQLRLSSTVAPSSERFALSADEDQRAMKRAQLLGVAIAGVCGLGALFGVMNLVNKPRRASTGWIGD